jgi:predicted metal-dependent enzyme (double-stranded beta helix superfamily)
MSSDDYQLGEFLTDFRAVRANTRSDAALLGQLRPLVLRFAQSKTWRKARHYECDAEQGFGVHVLHEEPDGDLWIIAVAWLPRRGAPPHNHGTWAVVAGVDGPEKNVHWKRVDDGSQPGHAELEKVGEETIGPGEVAAFLPGAIHSVTNETERVTLSLHVYGRNLNHANRSQFDPEQRTEKPFIVRVQ